MTKRKFISIFIPFICIIFFFTACIPEEEINPNQIFTETKNEIINSMLTNSPLDLHFCLSDTLEYDALCATKNLGHLSDEAVNSSIKFYETALNKIEAIDEGLLTKENAYDYKILKRYLTTEASLSSMKYKYEPLSPNGGEHIQLPLLLAEFPFKGTSDIEIYLSLLNDFGRYFDEIYNYELQKLHAGEFMSNDAFKSVVGFCNSFPTESTSEHFLHKAFESKLNSVNLDEALRASYIESHKELLETSVFPAYTKLSEQLFRLKDKAEFNDEGLCTRQAGREYYCFLVEQTIGDNRDFSAIGSDLENSLHTTAEAFTKAISDNSNLWDNILNGKLYDEVPAEDTLTTAKEYVDILYSMTTEDFGNELEKQFSIEYIEESLCNYFSGAFFLLPPVDNFNNPTIYINPTTEYTAFDLLTTLAHEGYPGHLQQTLEQKDNLFSRLFSCLGYCEGWATYCELYTYPLAVETLEIGEPSSYETIAHILKLYREMTLSVYALMDYNIHYNYWTLDDSISFLSDYGITNEESVKQIYNYIVNNPANYLTYYLGYINVLDLKEEYIANGHSETEFHRAFLECDEAPFDIIHEEIFCDE